MPKKSKTNKEKEEFFKELAEKLKEKSEKKEPRPDQEAPEETEDEFDLNNFNFQTFEPASTVNIGDTESSPVLEAITGEMPGPRFVRVGSVGGTSEAGTLGRNEDDNGATYIPTAEQNGEPKYIESSEQIYKTPEMVDMGEVGRRGVNEFDVPDQGAFFQRTVGPSESQSVERVRRPERVDLQTLGRQNPVEAEKEKYQKYDLYKKSY